MIVRVRADKFRACVAVYGMLISDGRLLFMRRAGSGFRDGQLSLPAGHLDGDEDAVAGLIRELGEELDIAVRREHCQLATLLHSRREDADDFEYLHLLFRVSTWTGRPRIAEPLKCTELIWVPVNGPLPDDVVDYIALGLGAVQAGVPYLAVGWPA